MNLKRTGVAAALLAATFLTAPASAQSLVGSVAGTITDEQGGAVPGVAVTLTGKTGAKTATTDADGRYRFVAIDPGTYSVQAQVSGFQPQRKDDVQISVGRTATVDFALKIGGMAESLEVVGEAPVVDTSSSATETGLSQDILFNLPISRTNAAVNIMNNLPGVNSGSAYGGDADSGNALMLDGVDTRDPEGGTAWTFFNYNIIEEVQVGGLGAPAEYGAFTGAFVNTITKSGGNRVAGLFDVNYTNDADIFSGNNITSEISAANPALADPATVTKLLDVTAQLSGPIIHDKLFFFASAQRYERITNPTGPVTVRDEVSPRINTKLTWQPGTNDTVTGTFQYDSYNIIGRPGVPALLATDALTNREDAPEYVWGGTWRHLFGSRTFSEVKFTGWTGFFDLNPEVNLPGHLDTSGQYSVSQGWFAYYDRGRNQVNASISHFADAFGKHDFKFGVEIERSRVRNRYGYVNDITYYDDGGAPYYAYDYGYDLGGKNRRTSVFAQDSWKVTDRLTLNPGIRLDANRGIHDPHEGQPDVGEVWNTRNIAPRLGFAFDLTGDNKTVLRGSYGQYYEGAFFGLWSSAVPGVQDYEIYSLADCPAFPCGPSQRELVDSVPATLYRIDPDIEHPRRDEMTVGVERALGRDFRLGLTGVWREGKNFVGSVLPSARWTPATVTTESAPGFSARPLPVYRWANPSASEEDVLITNPDGFQYLDPSGNVLGEADAEQKYKALMAVLSKRLSNRWQAQISYVLSKAEGTVNNTGASTFGAGRFFQTPTLALVNSRGLLLNDRRHEVKAYLTYQVPVIEVGLNTIIRSVSGRTYTPFQRFPSSTRDPNHINFPPSSAGRQPLLEPRGSRRLEREDIVDVRFDKYFRLGGRKDQISLYVDVQNVFNESTILARQTRVPDVAIAGVDDPVKFDAPTSVIAPRQITLGARLSF